MVRGSSEISTEKRRRYAADDRQKMCFKSGTSMGFDVCDGFFEHESHSMYHGFVACLWGFVADSADPQHDLSALFSAG